MEVVAFVVMENVFYDSPGLCENCHLSFASESKHMQIIIWISSNAGSVEHARSVMCGQSRQLPTRRQGDYLGQAKGEISPGPQQEGSMLSRSRHPLLLSCL